MSRALKIRTRLGRAPGPIRSFEQSFTENEVFILPTTKIRAPLLSSVEEDAAFHEFNGLVLRNRRVGNLLDCTSISLPLPVDGLPVGLMLIGPMNADDRRELPAVRCFRMVVAVEGVVPRGQLPQVAPAAFLCVGAEPIEACLRDPLTRGRGSVRPLHRTQLWEEQMNRTLKMAAITAASF
jgi:Amidase